MDKEFKDRERSITLANNEWDKLLSHLKDLDCFADQRIKEFQELMQELKADGTPRFPNAVGYLEFYLEMKANINSISNRIYEQRFN